MKTYDSLDLAYKDLSERLTSIARRHIYNRDYAVDAVHDAFVKAAEYVQKNPKRKVSGFLIARELMRACRRLNKRSSVEVPTDFSAQSIREDLEI